MTKKLQNKKGFTLTELIVVIVIIGILAAVLIPTLTGYINKANQSAAEQEARSYVEAYMSWEIETDNGRTTLTFVEYVEDLDMEVAEGAELKVTEVEDATTGDKEVTGFTYSKGKYVITYVAETGKLSTATK